jgi:clan AA aspartic protease
MITGTVNANREAIIPLIVRSSHGHEQEIEGIIDTGFTGSLTLPSTLISSLGLPWHGREQGVLGDGSVGLFDIYAATVIWDGHERIVETASANTDPLVGMGLFYGHELRIQAVEGGRVVIEALE